jgi:MtN3 and saliva related transmembrane protein
MQSWLPTVLGMVAGCCSTVAFVPQVLKIWREGDTRAISLRMYLVLTAGFVLWLGYGVVIGSWPVVVVNVANLALGGVILWLKLRAGKGGDTPATGLEPSDSATGCELAPVSSGHPA